jgi:hypothetical protein
MRWSVSALTLLSTCAQAPTVIDTEVASDGTVPPILILQMTVTNDANASLQSSSQQVSLNPGLEAGVPGPFSFPLVLPISVNSSLAGTVTVTVQGLDWNTSAAIAAGSTSAQVVAGKTTHAFLTLSSTTSSRASGAADAAPACEGGADGADE